MRYTITRTPSALLGMPKINHSNSFCISSKASLVAIPLAATQCQRGTAARKIASNRSLNLVVSNVAQFTRTASDEVIICAKIHAHSASVSSVLVLQDNDKLKSVVTTSLDKTVALWTSNGACDVLCNSGYTESQRLTPQGGPVFSLLLDRRSDDGMADQVYLGTHGKHVVAWVPPSTQLEAGVVLGGNCGWVRALASAGGRWLFSAACKEIRVWDMARAVPSLVGITVVDKGDILALSTNKKMVFTAGADGSIRSFHIGKNGELTVGACRPKAHRDRVSALVLDGGILFSSSYDGSIKAWDATTLEIVAFTESAHGGEKINCLAMDRNRTLYSGGADCMVRRWSLTGSIQEIAPPLHAHSHSVGALATGNGNLLVSGDNGGEVVVWKVSN